MLRRVLDGLVLGVIAWVVLTRFGLAAQIIVTGAVAVFTGWRLYALWGRYQKRIARQRAYRAAEPPSDDDAARRRALALRGQQLGRGAELTFWSGFILGGAAVSEARPFGGGGEAGEGGAYDPGTYDGGAGGDFGGGFDGGM